MYEMCGCMHLYMYTCDLDVSEQDRVLGGVRRSRGHGCGLRPLYVDGNGRVRHSYGRADLQRPHQPRLDDVRVLGGHGHPCAVCVPGKSCNISPDALVRVFAVVAIVDTSAGDSSSDIVL